MTWLLLLLGVVVIGWLHRQIVRVREPMTRVEALRRLLAARDAEPGGFSLR